VSRCQDENPPGSNFCLGCHLGLGKVYRRTDKREQVHAHLTTATTMYREMEMGFWLERAQAEGATLG
jgi:hypothetical protein